MFASFVCIFAILHSKWQRTVDEPLLLHGSLRARLCSVVSGFLLADDIFGHQAWMSPVLLKPLLAATSGNLFLDFINQGNAGHFEQGRNMQEYGIQEIPRQLVVSRIMNGPERSTSAMIQTCGSFYESSFAGRASIRGCR